MQQAERRSIVVGLECLGERECHRTERSAGLDVETQRLLGRFGTSDREPPFVVPTGGCMWGQADACRGLGADTALVAHELDGRFPFGGLSGRCEPHRVEDAAAFVLGVYPSALHVRWTHPEMRVSALAVAQEPWPFWPGDDQAERVDAWRTEIGWRQEWGRLQPVGRLNGSSGQVLQSRVLEPLGFDPAQAWTTDALPFFHVHRGEGTQGAAMTERYDDFALSHGLPVHSLPTRPPVDQLVRRAIEDEGERLRQELRESRTPLLITLGNEALAVAAALVDGDLPATLRPDESYGKRVAAHLGEMKIEVLPLVHPGQRSATWLQVHDRWSEALD